MNRLLQLTAFTLLLGCTAFTSLHAATGRDLARSILLPDTVLARSTELALTATQREAVEREQSAFRSTAAKAFTATRRAADALADQLSKEKPDEAAVLARFDELNAAETQLKRERLVVTIRLKNILTPAQFALLQSSSAHPPERAGQLPTAFDQEPRPGTASSGERATIPELLQQARAGIEQWRAAGRDLTQVNALWDRFRRHADAREHPQARQALQELITLLSKTPPSSPPPAPSSAP